jgi:hypothetical protein
MEKVALEVTKSMFSCSLALALFTGRELTGLLFDPVAPLKDASVLFSALADAMASRLGPSGHSVFAAADRIQRNITDSFFASSGDSPEDSTGWGPIVHDGSEGYTQE